MKRATKKEFNDRVRKVAGLKARNASRSEIVAYGTKEWVVNTYLLLTLATVMLIW